MQTLIDKIRRLGNHYHAKRGFRLKDVRPEVTGCHLVEEAVEVMAEILEKNHQGITEEVGDLLCLIAQVCIAHHIDFSGVLEVAHKKLNKFWIEDPADIITKTPGFTRRNRDNEQ